MKSLILTSRNHRRSPRFALRRAVAMAFIALCKVALLLATLEVAVEALESNAEVAQRELIDLANPPEGIHVSRRILVKRLPTRCLRAGLTAEAARRGGPMAHTAVEGHRLANRLCAPMRC